VVFSSDEKELDSCFVFLALLGVIWDEKLLPTGCLQSFTEHCSLTVMSGSHL